MPSLPQHEAPAQSLPGMQLLRRAESRGRLTTFEDLAGNIVMMPVYGDNRKSKSKPNKALSQKYFVKLTAV
jgi:hypothetical protein